MSKAYDIIRWDATYTGGPDNISPVLTIRPDLDLLRMVQSNNFSIPIKITETQSLYDNKLAMAKVEPSEYILGYRPQYQKETNTITITPNITWNSYPLKLGKVSVLVSNQEWFIPDR